MSLFDIVDAFKDLAEETVDALSEFKDDICEVISDGVDEFLSDPVEYSVESTKDICRATTSLATFPIRPITNTLESIADSCRDQVHPVIGSVLYTDLIFGYAEHSGIYIGNDEIVELNSKGNIEIVSAVEFVSGGTGVHIYVSCQDTYPVGSEKAAELALDMAGNESTYGFLTNNCHMFTAGCITGNFNNSNTFLWMLKDEAKNQLGANDWRIWNKEIF